jgi:hypothetical protein
MVSDLVPPLKAGIWPTTSPDGASTSRPYAAPVSLVKAMVTFPGLAVKTSVDVGGVDEATSATRWVLLLEWVVLVVLPVLALEHPPAISRAVTAATAAPNRTDRGCVALRDGLECIIIFPMLQAAELPCPDLGRTKAQVIDLGLLSSSCGLLHHLQTEASLPPLRLR